MRDFPLTALAAGITVLVVTGFVSSEMFAWGVICFFVFLAIRWALEQIFGVYE